MNKEEWLKNCLQVLAAMAAGTVFCMVAVLLFAFIVKVAQLPSEVIMPVTRVIKASGIFLGAMCLLSGRGSLVKGVISGMGMVLLTYIVFSMISGTFLWDWTDFVELVFGGMIGGISGGICAVVKRD